MVEISGGIDDIGVIQVVLATLDNEDRQVRICFRQPAGYNTGRGSS